MLLKVDGHQVKAVGNGTEALEELLQCDYDFVFTDHILDGMLGEELARSIKANDPLQIVGMFTAHAEFLDEQPQEDCFVDFTLRKPIAMPLLRKILECLAPEKPLLALQPLQSLASVWPEELVGSF
jgi:CheY-like chemotaxis protein